MINIFKKLDHICDKFKYGYVDVDGNVHKKIDSEFDKNYILRHYINIIEHEYGCCFDHVEVIRNLYLENAFNEVYTYFIMNENGDRFPHGHTITLMINDSVCYWYSPDYDNVYGKLRKYDNITLALKELKKLFIETIDIEYKEEDIIIYEYIKPQVNLNCEQFYEHCRNGRIVNIE